VLLSLVKRVTLTACANAFNFSDNLPIYLRVISFSFNILKLNNKHLPVLITINKIFVLSVQATIPNLSKLGKW